MTIIAVASIVIAGITTGFGTMGPALAEGKAVATALSSLAQQPDASATITRTLSSKRQEALKNEEQTLHQAIRQRTQQEVFAIARKALQDLATASLEERLGDVFTRRLREMKGNAKGALAEAVKTA